MKVNIKHHCISNPGHLGLLGDLYLEEIKRVYEILTIEGLFEKPTEIAISKEIISAVHHGQPPRIGIERITVGRSRELSTITDLLKEAGARRALAPLLILGDYGTGKTHLLNCARSLAFRSNLLVFQVDILGDKVSMAEPVRLKRQVVSGLRFPDLLTTRGRRDILLKLILRRVRYLAEEELRSRGERIYSLPTLLFSIEKRLASGMTVPDQDLRKAAVAYLQSSGESIGPILESPAIGLVEFSSALASLSRDLGFQGATVLVDELEEDRSAAAFGALKDMLDKEPEGIAWIFAATRDLVFDSRTGLARYDREIAKRLIGHSLDIEPLSMDDFEELFIAVTKIFDLANGTNLTESISVGVRSSYLKRRVGKVVNPREFLMQLVEDLFSCLQGRGPLSVTPRRP